MRNLQKNINSVMALKKTQGQIQPHRQKKKISQSAVGYFRVGQKSQGLH